MAPPLPCCKLCLSDPLHLVVLSSVISYQTQNAQNFRRELGKTHVVISNGAVLPFWCRSCRISALHYLKNLLGLFVDPLLP